MEKSRLLVIDDDPNLRRTLSDILKAKGYDAFTAKDGTEGLALLKRHGANDGWVDVASRLGKGTTFTVVLPITGGAA